MATEYDIGLDSQCLSFLIDAIQGIAMPGAPIAPEKLALVRTYLYTPGTLWVTPTVEEECAPIKNLDRRALHESWMSAVFGVRPVTNPQRIQKRAEELHLTHKGLNDCRILAEAEDVGLDVLVSFDADFVAHLRRLSAVKLQEPMELWSALNIAKGCKPDKVPHATNPLGAQTWWQW